MSCSIRLRGNDTMADLTDTLANLGLNTSRVKYHTLHLSYPATDLLPPDAVPSLEPPRNVVYREHPCLNTFLLEANDLNFFHRFRLQGHQTGPSALEDFGNSCEGLIMTVESLKNQPPGRSMLDFAVYFDSLDGMMYVFRLSVYPHGAAQAQTRYFRINQLKIESLYAVAELHTWAALVIDLIEQASDRAYLHAQQNLQAQDQEFALAREMSNARLWATRCPPTARQMLMRSLVHECGNTGVPLLSDLDDENLQAHADQELDVWPPCGHKTTVTFRKVGSLTESDCLTLECNKCDQRVLTKADRETILLGNGQAIREDYIQCDLYWAALDEPIASTDLVATLFGTAAIGEALLEALDTMRVPVSATPASLCAVNFAETAVAMAALHEHPKLAGSVLKVCPGELMAMLAQKAVEAIVVLHGGSCTSDIDLPPGYSAWLERLVRRAVNTVTGGSRQRTREAVANLGELLDKVRMD